MDEIKQNAKSGDVYLLTLALWQCQMPLSITLTHGLKTCNLFLSLTEGKEKHNITRKNKSIHVT